MVEKLIRAHWKNRIAAVLLILRKSNLKFMIVLYNFLKWEVDENAHRCSCTFVELTEAATRTCCDLKAYY